MKISEAYGPGKWGLSFELYPPKTAKSEKDLYQQLEKLAGFRPDFVTCTYGAGGSTREKTLDIISEVKKRLGCPTASHLTCVCATVDDLREYLKEASKRGIENIVALRGDPPQGETEFKATANGLRYANELVALIREEFPEFGIAVAGYPEPHREAPSAEIDLDNLKRKVGAGADAVVTQLFYKNENFFEFRDRYEACGIKAPLIPGILPITNLAQIKRIASLCGAYLPPELLTSLEKYADDPEGQFKVGVEFATKQVQELVDQGVPGMHFYVLNKSKATAEVLDALSLPQRLRKLAG
ncbi:Methylenetetrahydrofolate reductase [Planctomycetales bacterium 10988]|nr:Methylenetetrahydrofolate reductase [Planctomycetales bacterium 10988]